MLAIALPLVVTLASQTPAPANANANVPAKHAKVRVLVLDFKAVGISEGEAALLRDAAASRLGKSEKLEVVSAGEMKTLVDVEASRQATGNCDPAATQACLAEIAGALGADYVVAGNVGKLGDSVVVNVSLLDAKKGDAIARDTLTTPSLDDALVKLGDEMDKFGDALHARVDGGGPNPALFWSGAVVGGVGAVVAIVGVGWCAASEYTLEARDGKPADKQRALDSRFAALGTAGGGLALVVVGAVLVGVAEATE